MRIIQSVLSYPVSRTHLLTILSSLKLLSLLPVSEMFLNYAVAFPLTVLSAFLPDDYPTVQFWCSLREKTPNYSRITENSIRFDDVYWMDSKYFRHSLYIQSVYHRFWEIVNGNVDSWIVTGTPGIGKTFFTFYIFVKIRKEQPTAIIAWMDENEMLIFYPNGNIQKAVNVPDETAHGMGNWIIAEATPLRTNSVFCRTVLVTFPKFSNYWNLMKKGIKSWCMPVWSIEEIQQVHAVEYSHHKWEVIETSFDKWGGVPRIVLEFVDNPDWKFDLWAAFSPKLLFPDHSGKKTWNRGEETARVLQNFNVTPSTILCRPSRYIWGVL